jgi:hypothetical protein
VSVEGARDEGVHAEDDHLLDRLDKVDEPDPA